MLGPFGVHGIGVNNPPVHALIAQGYGVLRLKPHIAQCNECDVQERKLQPHVVSDLRQAFLESTLFS